MPRECPNTTFLPGQAWHREVHGRPQCGEEQDQAQDRAASLGHAATVLRLVVPIQNTTGC